MRGDRGSTYVFPLSNKRLVSEGLLNPNPFPLLLSRHLEANGRGGLATSDNEARTAAATDYRGSEPWSSGIHLDQDVS